MIDWKRVQDALEKSERRLAQKETGQADVHGILLAVHAEVLKLSNFVQTAVIPMRPPAASQHDAEQDRRIGSLAARITRGRVELWHLLVAVVAAIVGGWATGRFGK